MRHCPPPLLTGHDSFVFFAAHESYARHADSAELPEGVSEDGHGSENPSSRISLQRNERIQTLSDRVLNWGGGEYQQETMGDALDDTLDGEDVDEESDDLTNQVMTRGTRP